MRTKYGNRLETALPAGAAIAPPFQDIRAICTSPQDEPGRRGSWPTTLFAAGAFRESQNIGGATFYRVHSSNWQLLRRLVMLRPSELINGADHG